MSRVIPAADDTRLTICARTDPFRCSGMLASCIVFCRACGAYIGAKPSCSHKTLSLLRNSPKIASSRVRETQLIVARCLQICSNDSGTPCSVENTTLCNMAVLRRSRCLTSSSGANPASLEVRESPPPLTWCAPFCPALLIGHMAVRRRWRSTAQWTAFAPDTDTTPLPASWQRGRSAIVTAVTRVGPFTR